MKQTRWSELHSRFSKIEIGQAVSVVIEEHEMKSCYQSMVRFCFPKPYSFSYKKEDIGDKKLRVELKKDLKTKRSRIS